tara:strand:- start:997 stop:1632 length:636 start_codon:yes stop_codon:yes gene_type:complete
MIIENSKNFFWKIYYKKSLNNWFKRNFDSPSPEFVKHKVLKRFNLENSTWIETGTYYGDTTKYLSKFAKKIFTIEADTRLFNIAKKRFDKSKTITVIYGESEKIVAKLFIEENLTENICFYLDAHLCQDHILNKKTYGKENDGTPILNELKTIENQLENFKNINIIIDDIRLFGTNFQNYPSLDSLVNWSKKIRSKWHIEHDMFIIQYKKN